ncbi:transketolase [Candidatus Woesearchaeota archaeon]|nr:transketolase [Candidatus Woesearchaeota archaeon]
MRNAFAEELVELAKENKNIFVLSGDIGNRLFDRYKELFPDRFLNCGVAEQNMMGVAAGMALTGLRPVAYTITPFITMRCFEQIRNDLCYHNLPVVIVGVGSGLCYAVCGPTHHSCEDIAILRALPNMTVICPGDAYEVKAALKAALGHSGPVYIRLGKKREPLVHKKIPDFKIGRGITVKEGDDVCLLGCGNILPVAVKAGEVLEKKGVSAKVVSFHTVKPLDKDLLSEAFSRFKLVVTLEEHSLLGGFGGAVAEFLADQPEQKARLLRIGTPDAFMDTTGDHEYARNELGLTPDAIVKKILDIYGVKQ